MTAEVLPFLQQTEGIALQGEKYLSNEGKQGDYYSKLRQKGK